MLHLKSDVAVLGTSFLWTIFFAIECIRWVLHVAMFYTVWWKALHFQIALFQHHNLCKYLPNDDCSYLSHVIFLILASVQILWSIWKWKMQATNDYMLSGPSFKNQDFPKPCFGLMPLAAPFIVNEIIVKLTSPWIKNMYISAHLNQTRILSLILKVAMLFLRTFGSHWVSGFF